MQIYEKIPCFLLSDSDTEKKSTIAAPHQPVNLDKFTTDRDKRLTDALLLTSPQNPASGNPSLLPITHDELVKSQIHDTLCLSMIIHLDAG